MNVYEATQARLKIIFEEFDNIVVSFSGGKDSGAILNLCIDYMRAHGIKRKISVLHLDYEAQYEYTTKYVDETLSSNLDILDIYRCCVSFKASTATSMHETYWRPWELAKKDIWVRELPTVCHTSTDFDFFNENIWDYDFQAKFGDWIHKRNSAEKTCVLIGIRTQESLNRWRAIHSDKNYKHYKNIKWIKPQNKGVWNAYPIFDWQTTDIWTATAKFCWSYNKLYDLFYQAGVPIEQMRVSSPFHSYAKSSLRLYRAIEPHTWGKLVSRVNGVNFTGIYGGTTAMGWKSISLPKGYTWQNYMNFLLGTLPEAIKNNYLNQLQGHHLDDNACKSVCVCIIKNDHLLQRVEYKPGNLKKQKRAKMQEKYSDL